MHENYLLVSESCVCLMMGVHYIGFAIYLSRVLCFRGVACVVVVDGNVFAIRECLVCVSAVCICV